MCAQAVAMGAAGAALRLVVAELSLELQQAREELTAAGNVTRLPVRRDGAPVGAAGDRD